MDAVFGELGDSLGVGDAVEGGSIELPGVSPEFDAESGDSFRDGFHRLRVSGGGLGVFEVSGETVAEERARAEGFVHCRVPAPLGCFVLDHDLERVGSVAEVERMDKLAIGGGAGAVGPAGGGGECRDDGGAGAAVEVLPDGRIPILGFFIMRK